MSPATCAFGPCALVNPRFCDPGRTAAVTHCSTLPQCIGQENPTWLAVYFALFWLWDGDRNSHDQGSFCCGLLPDWRCSQAVDQRAWYSRLPLALYRRDTCVSSPIIGNQPRLSDSLAGGLARLKLAASPVVRALSLYGLGAPNGTPNPNLATFPAELGRRHEFTRAGRRPIVLATREEAAACRPAGEAMIHDMHV